MGGSVAVASSIRRKVGCKRGWLPGRRALVEADEQHPSVTAKDIYRMLRGAPNRAKALQLAAKLRRAGRDGRPLKNGLKINVEDVDEAMDVLLQSSQRHKQSVLYEDELEQKRHGRPKEQRKDDEPMPQEVWVDNFDNADSELQQPFSNNVRSSNNDDIEAMLQNELGQHRSHMVPEDTMAAVINEKFNYVDRSWSAAFASDLPIVPSAPSSQSKDMWLRLPHIAVNGMTNSGKSSLINHCLKWSYAAKASSVPGKTVSIDFYCVNRSFILVDLPGYPDPEKVAYMGVMKNWEERWEMLVMTYLQMCANGEYDLRLLLHLQTSRKKCSGMSIKFMEAVNKMDLPTLLILTKDDQLKNPHKERNFHLDRIKQDLKFEGPHLHYSVESSMPNSRKARRKLHRFIRTTIGGSGIEESRQILHRACPGKRDPVAAAGDGGTLGEIDA